MYLGNTSKDVTVDNMKKNWLIGLDIYIYIYQFFVDYDAIDVSDIVGIHKYLIKKHNRKWWSNLSNKLL